MQIVISPAKNINTEIQIPAIKTTMPRFQQQSQALLKLMKTFTPEDLSKLMKISDKLAVLNFERFQQMSFPLETKNTIPAIFAFNGAVFQGINIASFSIPDLVYAQNHLNIISGLYGLLRPLDGIMPYRLEMGTALKSDYFTNLYHFWGEKLQQQLIQSLNTNNENVLVNLASNEYFKALVSKSLSARIITPVFKDFKNGKYKMITIYAKQARGFMTSFILKNRIEVPDEIKLFDEAGYEYNDHLSKGDEWVFTRN